MVKEELKILLVEDNFINIEVFVRFLDKEGLNCDIAENGFEALKACENKDYDIIFMDCQMPVMDGYEATRRIRAVEGYKKPSAIIAMTAYSTDEDALKCIEAGMDEYLSKPINLVQIRNVLQKYYQTSEYVTSEEINFYSNTLRAFARETGFDRQTCEELLVAYCRQTERLIEKIKENLACRNYDEIKMILHKLKGSSLTIKADEIVECLLDIKEAVESERIERINDSLNHIEGLVSDLKRG